jgi:hypothetical protein
MQLAMDIAAYCDWCFDWGGVCLLLEDGLCLLSDQLNLFLCDGLKGPQVIDDHIYFGLIHAAII